MAGTSSTREIIDFSDERRRHRVLLGREDPLGELTALCDEAAVGGGWVLVQGGPGLGKSALLSHWLGSLEAPRWPHHFIRRSVEDWDQPGRIVASLAAQVEATAPWLTRSSR